MRSRKVSFCNTTQRTRTGAYCKCLLHLAYTRCARMNILPWLNTLLTGADDAGIHGNFSCSSCSATNRVSSLNTVHELCALWTYESLLAVYRRTTWPLMQWMDVTTCCLQLHWGLETKTKNFETKTETSGIRSRESRPRPRPGKMNSSALESRNLGLESTTLNPKPMHNAQ